jgi:hypothetical protein
MNNLSSNCAITWRLWALTLAAVSACGERAEAPPAISEISPEGLLISESSGHLARPVDLDVDANGSIYILDRLDRRIVSVSPNGNLRFTFGRPGGGPGELSTPLALGVDADGRLRVFDFQTRRIQIYSPDGEYLTGHHVELAGVPIRIAFGREGELVYTGPSVVLKGGLVALNLPRSEPVIFGEVVALDATILPTFLDELHARRLPLFMRNSALPVIAEDGVVAVFLQAEGVLRRYRQDGSMLDSAVIRIPEMEAIQRDFFDWYAQIQTPDVVRYFEYVDDAVFGGGLLWMLWKTPPAMSALLTIHTQDGTLLRRVSLNGLEGERMAASASEAPRIRRLGIDLNRSRIYVSDSIELTLTSFSIPADWHR